MTVLQVPADAPQIAQLGAAALLFLHIGGGSLGIAAGWVAVTSRKGEKVHRAAGRVFFAAMMVCYTVAGLVAPFLTEGRRANTIAAILALYLVLSSWRTVRREDATPEWQEGLGFAVAIAIVAISYVFMRLGAAAPGEAIGGAPPEALLIFIFAASLAALGDLNFILRKGLSPAGRIARHLWRMCYSFFIASGSFFLGQQKVMPEWMRGSPVLTALALAPIAFLIFYLVKVRLFDGKPQPRTTQAS